MTSKYASPLYSTSSSPSHLFFLSRISRYLGNVTGFRSAQKPLPTTLFFSPRPLSFIPILRFTTVNPCQTRMGPTCLNGGVCRILEVEDSFNCTCHPAFTGTYCQVPRNGYQVPRVDDNKLNLNIIRWELFAFICIFALVTIIGILCAIPWYRLRRDEYRRKNKYSF